MSFEINSRIKFLIEDVLEISPYEFSKNIGNKRPDGLYKILDNKTKPSPKTLNKISERYPNLNMDWLLNGGGGPVLKMGKNRLSEDEDEDANKDTPVKNAILEGEVREDQQSYPDHLDLLTVRNEVRSDLKVLLDGMTENFRVLHKGVMQGLQDHQKILRFIDDLDQAKVVEAAKELDEFLKARK